MGKNVLLATHNKSKIERYKTYLSVAGITFVTLSELSLSLTEPEENGASEWENAMIKAKAYGDLTSLPALSNDTGLYITGLSDKEQPGKFTQRAAGVTDSDTPEERFDKITRYYTQIAARFGGEVQGYFNDVYCLFTGKEYLKAEALRPITLTTIIHERKDLSFPLCSFYRANSCGKFYHDMNDEEMQGFLAMSNEAARTLLTQYALRSEEA